MVERFPEEEGDGCSIHPRGTIRQAHGKHMETKRKIVAVSGGFDPLHVGHVELFREAKKLGDVLVVILNNDNWLMKKKTHIFMPEHERAEIIKSLEMVDDVVLTDHEENPEDMSVSEILRHIKPDIFANGGDRKTENTPEDIVCGELEIEMVFNLGQKIQSSSWLLGDYLKKNKN